MIKSFRINEGNTGVCPWPQNSSNKEHSAYNIGGLIWSSPVTSLCGKFAYFGSSNRKFVCIKVDTNELIWSYSIPNIRDNSLIDSTAAISPCGKMVVIPGGDGALHALNAYTGEVIWQFCVSAKGNPVGNYDDLLNEPVTGVTVASFEGNVKFMRGDNVIAGCDNGYIYSVDADTGKLNWSFNAGLMIWGVACIVESRYILIGGLNGVIYLLDDNENGRLVAKYKCEGDVKGSIAVENQEFFIGSSTGKIYCLKLDIDKGKINKIWSVDTGAEVYSSLAIYKDHVFLANMFGNVYAFNKKTGKLAWKTYTYNSISSSPCISSDGLLYIGTNGGRLIVIYTDTGAIKSFFTLHKGKVYNNNDDISLRNEKYTALNSSPMLLEDGICMIGSYDGHMYMVNTSIPQNNIQICPYEQNTTHFEITSTKCCNIIIATLRATKPNTNIFEDVTVINKVNSFAVTDNNNNNFTDAYRIVISANANSVILIPSNKWVEYMTNYTPEWLNLNINVKFTCRPLLSDKWIHRYYSIKNANRHISQRVHIATTVTTHNNIDLYTSSYDVRNGSCTDPVILDTYIPAAFDSLGYVMHFIKDMSKKLKWVLLIPSLPDDEGNTVIRDDSRIIILEIISIKNNMFTARNKEAIVLSSMGGTFPLYDIAISGAYDPEHKRFNISMYSNSSCLGIRCNGSTYQFSEKVVNQLCDKNLNSHIVTTFYAYPRSEKSRDLSQNKIREEEAMYIWVHKGSGTCSTQGKSETHRTHIQHSDCTSELFIDLDRAEITNEIDFNKGCLEYKRDVSYMSLNRLVNSSSTFKEVKYFGVILVVIANVVFIYKPDMYILIIICLLLRTLIDASNTYYNPNSFKLGNIYDNISLALYVYTILSLIVYILFTPHLLIAYGIGLILLILFLVIRIYYINSLNQMKRIYLNNSIVFEGLISTLVIYYATRRRLQGI
jgi:outer membrane protein assembly factor BamB